jgi:trk system potassium uptake protein TrkA
MGIRERIARLFRRKPANDASGSKRRDAGPREFVVIGLGVFGRSLALRLSQLGFTVLGIDRDAIIVQAVADELSAALVLDATNEEALRQADVTSYDTAIVAIGGNHFEATALTTISLAKLGVPNIIAIGASHRQVEILQAIGATRVIDPVEEGAVALADELTDPGRGDAWSITPDDQLARLPLPPQLIDQPVGECNRMGLTVLLVAREGKTAPFPDPTFLLHADDELVVLGPPLQVLALRRLA